MAFQYYNPNPLYDGKARSWKNSDCTIRSICAATGSSWVDVYRRLCEAGLRHYVVPIHMKAYREVITKFGFKSIKKCKENELTVRDIALRSKKDGKIYLCKVKNHVVCCRNGFILDTWDSSDCSVTEYWSN